VCHGNNGTATEWRIQGHCLLCHCFVFWPVWMPPTATSQPERIPRTLGSWLTCEQVLNLTTQLPFSADATGCLSRQVRERERERKKEIAGNGILLSSRCPKCLANLMPCIKFQSPTAFATQDLLIDIH